MEALLVRLIRFEAGPRWTFAARHRASALGWRTEPERWRRARNQDADGVPKCGYLFLLRPGRGGGGGVAFVVGSNLPPFFGSYVPCLGSAMVVPLVCPAPLTLSEDQTTRCRTALSLEVPLPEIGRENLVHIDVGTCHRDTRVGGGDDHILVEHGRGLARTVRPRPGLPCPPLSFGR